MTIGRNSVVPEGIDFLSEMETHFSELIYNEIFLGHTNITILENYVDDNDTYISILTHCELQSFIKSPTRVNNHCFSF